MSKTIMAVLIVLAVLLAIPVMAMVWFGVPFAFVGILLEIALIVGAIYYGKRPATE